MSNLKDLPAPIYAGGEPIFNNLGRIQAGLPKMKSVVFLDRSVHTTTKWPIPTGRLAFIQRHFRAPSGRPDSADREALRTSDFWLLTPSPALHQFSTTYTPPPKETKSVAILDTRGSKKPFLRHQTNNFCRLTCSFERTSASSGRPAQPSDEEDDISLSGPALTVPR